ncbi:Protein CBG06109 [Caenorhabditis briggsae]|uniref:Protein CBG06109 n=1 Tax=Caenorhabditis briggsae TaxID=6238 RepID=A8X0V8_CAEBR|nr:Protein CBG06109 [Caenorhabditis briggsae]CAP26268.1 Protein CBG06109 [Caenorhabditis briggsae]
MAKKKSVKSNNGLNDERFSRIKSDPMFSGLKSSDKKVVIDKRFAAALTDERFSTRAKVDMRGRKQKKTVGNNMLDLYELEEDEDDQQKNKKSTEKKLKNKRKKVEEDDKELDEFFDENDGEEEEVDDEEDADDEKEGTDNEEVEDEKEKTVGLNGFKKLDLARGEGNVDSSSDDDSSDEEEDELDEQEQGIELDLANLDRDVDQVEWTSRRLAVCNLEWDQMNCEDILMLVKSFTPQEGSVVSVGIYLSDFGKEELEKEEKTGPALKLAKPVEEYKEDEMDDETRTAVREYLVNKLKHYYAVITFDSVPSAVAVYEECDGFQFEETGLKMDMRFIPDDMEFEEDRVKEFLNAEDVNMAKYKAKKKSKSAIISTGAKIGWDEDDPSRKKKFLEAFNGDEEAGKDLIVDSDDSDDDESNRNKLMALLHTDERKSKLDVDWEGEEKDDDDDGSDSSDGEYVKVDDDDDEIGVKNKNKDSDDEEEDVETKQEEEKLTGYKAYKKKQKAKLMENKLKRKGTAAGEAVANIKTVAAAETIASDDRFSALFTDSAFAIEPSSKKFKGSLLVSKQAEQKLKGSTISNESKPSSQPEDLVQKLKKQADKWNKKKSAPRI